LAHDPGSGQPLDGGARARRELAGAVRLGHQRTGRVVALGRVSQGLPRHRVVAGRQQLDVTAEPAVERLDVGAQVLQRLPPRPWPPCDGA
jgi:hypothetical protein